MYCVKTTHANALFKKNIFIKTFSPYSAIRGTVTCKVNFKVQSKKRKEKKNRFLVSVYSILAKEDEILKKSKCY